MKWFYFWYLIIIPTVFADNVIRTFSTCKLSSSYKTIYKNSTCNFKTLTKNHKSLSLTIYFKRPVYNGFVSFHFSATYLDSFLLQMNMDIQVPTGKYLRTLFKLEKVEICKILNGTDGNPFLSQFWKRAGENFSKFMHACPYFV